MTAPLFDTEDSEIVVALVAPIGCNREYAHIALKEIFEGRGYTINDLKLSDALPFLADAIDVELKERPYLDRVNSYMDAGTKLRRQSGRGDVLALSAVNEIAQRRPVADAGSPLDQRLLRHVHVLDSLKHPDEVRSLRQIYGPGFYLVGVFAPRAVRKRHLIDERYLSEEQAEQLLNRDAVEEAEREYGQRTRDTFHLSDVFIDVSNTGRAREALERFFALVFGDPFITPNADEFGMQAAASASFRSGALARQIGAALVNKRGDLISVGHNEVPRAGGGLYCATDSPDGRDLALGVDTNTQRLKEIAREAARELERAGLIGDVDGAAQVLAGSKLRDITEYGRTVHAEMEALLAAARTGVAVRRATLYTSTFPCHNCAKHVVAAGVDRVVYIEPYPKSEALLLHGDAILHAGEEDPRPRGAEEGSDRSGPVVLEPFMGVAPRRFAGLFGIVRPDGTELERKGADGRRVELPPRERTHPRIPMLSLAYPDREEKACAVLIEVHNRIREAAHGEDGTD